MPKVASLSGIFLLTSLALASCDSQTDTPTGQGTLVTYQCQDGTEFTARIAENEAIADLPDRPNLALPLVEHEGETRYSDGSTTLIIDGEKAVVEVNNAIVLTECTLAASGPDSSSPTTSEPPISEPTTSITAPGQPIDSGIRIQRVQFQPGATSAVVEDTIVGYETVDYVLNAQAGQYANISMATDNGANYFNLLPPGSNDEAIFVGSASGNQYEGTLPASGDYRVRVYLMRSAARRDEAADYRLEMIVSGGSNVEGDALVPGTPYNATGNIPCAMTPAEANGSCAFGVVREGNGNGFVEVTTQYGSTFSIYFQNGEAVGAEEGAGAFSADRQGDETFVYIGEERYIIPDAVIYGG